jgi:hypothetical protein
MDIGKKSIGFLIDELITTNIKCFMAQDRIMDINLPSASRLLAAEIAQQMNARRNLLVKKIDEILGQGELSPTSKTYHTYFEEKK